MNRTRTAQQHAPQCVNDLCHEARVVFVPWLAGWTWENQQDRTTATETGGVTHGSEQHRRLRRGVSLGHPGRELGGTSRAVLRCASTQLFPSSIRLHGILVRRLRLEFAPSLLVCSSLCLCLPVRCCQDPPIFVHVHGAVPCPRQGK